jgi:hypothetical protein
MGSRIAHLILPMLAQSYGNAHRCTHIGQGCQMVYFQTKNPNLCKFWRVLKLQMLVYFMSIW